MKFETEITVLVLCDYITLKNELFKHGFKIKQLFDLHDCYMINNDIDLTKYSVLDLITKCVIIRDIAEEKKELLYKYKRFAKDGDIIEQAKVECPIIDTNKGIEFMEAINYTQLFEIHDRCFTFVNDETEMMVQVVNNKYIFIEMEASCKYIDRTYKDDIELIEDLKRYHLPIDTSNYYVKKAVMILEEVLKATDK